MAAKLLPSTELPGHRATTQRFSQILSEDDFSFLYEKLYPIRTDWFNFGLALGLSISNLKEIDEDNRKSEICFRETLHRLVQTSQLTYGKITVALRKPTLQHNNLAIEIESAIIAMDSPTQAPNILVRNLSLEKLCLLPVDKVWYQFGLWLGVEEGRLIKIKEQKDKKLKLFKAFLKLPYVSPLYKCLCISFTDGQKEQAQRLIKSEKYVDFIKLFPLDNQITAKKVVDISKSLFTRLLTALVKVGMRDVAENICSEKDILLSNLLNIKPPPGCVVIYAEYLKSKYREMSILPDPDWPPAITTKEHYTNLALIQKEKNYTKEDMNQLYTDYAHGNIDSIIAKKTDIALEEAFYPIINLETNESRLTILMDGAPGVGKTTITRKVCIDWAKGEAIPEYQLVVLVPLRELKILQKFDQQLHLSDILPSDSKELQQNVIRYMERVSGAETLIIFDGFDELSSKERNFLQQSLVLDIIKGNKLHCCSVMITSRPYASQRLRSLSKVNRHIEVLGFTTQQIHDCVCTNIPGKEGTKLIQKLKERLDIGSLCYIPLNCRIVLFVYERQGFNLPSTITELYEIFLLHTIKRFAQNVALDEDVSRKIIGANNLNQIPHIITVQLNALSKISLQGIKEGKLVFDTENLKEHVSLGLLNSLHCFTTTGEAAFFQFLHLTIQEFLAARYVASDAMTDEQRKSFIRSNIENETYRMTLLFLAGLTRFSFLSSGDSLLSSLSTFLSGSSEKERILFLAQIIYESKSSSDYILSDLNGILDMSGFHLTKFDCLVLAHLMSNTPRGFVWEFIDLSNCGITSYSVLLKTKHSEHLTLPLSKTLSFFDKRRRDLPNSCIPIPSVLAILSNSKDSPVEELTLPVGQFDKCQGMVQLSQALVNLKFLKKFEIVVGEDEDVKRSLFRGSVQEFHKLFQEDVQRSHSKDSVQELHKLLQNYPEKFQQRCTISKDEFVLQCRVCSNFLLQLLKFASVKIEKLKISGAVVVFKDCSTCGSLGEDAVKSLCEFLRKCKNIEQVKFSESCLKGCTMQSIISSLSVSKICFKEKCSEICDTELVEMLQYLPRKCVFHFSSKKVSIVFKTNENNLNVTNHNDSKASGYENFLTNIKCIFPQRFSHVSIERYAGLFQCLSHNTNLKMITLILSSDHFNLQQDKVALKKRILELSKSLTSVSLRINGLLLNDYGDILEYLAKGQNNTFCMEVTVKNDSHGQTFTGLNTLLNSLISTPVQKLCLTNVYFNIECTKTFIEILSRKQLTVLVMEGSSCFTDSSCKPSAWKTWRFFRSFQMKSLTEISFSNNSLKIDGTVALLNFLRINPQLTVLRASSCDLTDDLFTDTHYWQTSSLKELIINWNDGISIEGWTNLFQSLRHNTSLIKLNCYCDADISEVLNEMIISNKCIQYLAIHGTGQCKSLARALVQNLTLKEITYNCGIKCHESVNDLERVIQKLKRNRYITISPEWNLKIRYLNFSTGLASQLHHLDSHSKLSRVMSCHALNSSDISIQFPYHKRLQAKNRRHSAMMSNTIDAITSSSCL